MVTDAVLAPHTRVGDKYVIEQMLGEGGMARVYLATHEWTERSVAIKVLRKELTEHDEVVERFFREARVLTKLRHPNVVDVIDMGHDPKAGVYLVMEHLTGETLESKLRRDGRMRARDVVGILAPVVDGLRSAHHMGVTDRDLKPENIFITSSVRRAVLPKILDFGIAKMHEANRSLRTETGVALGTPAYMSPEQVTAVGDVDHRTDIWALGVVIYECLSGVLPFDAPNLTALLHRISTVQYVPLGARPEGGYDPTLMAIVDRCLRLNPSQRFQSMGELLGALAQSPAWDAEALGSLRPPSAPVMLGEEEPEDTEVRAQAAVPDRALRTAPGAPTLVDVPGVGGAGEGAGAVGATDGFEGATTGELRAALTGRRSGARVLGVAILVAALVAVGVILMRGGAGEAAMPAASPVPSAAPAAVPSEGEAREPAAEPEPSEGSTVGSAAGLGADAARDLDAGVDAGGAVAPKVGTRGRTHVKSRRVSKPRGRKTIEVPPEL